MVLSSSRMSPPPEPAETFMDALARNQGAGPPPEERRWLFVPYDQLNHRLGPLSRNPPDTLGIVMVETPWKGRRRPYHLQKLALILANQRHFALEQAERGVAVDYRLDRRSYAAVLRQAAAQLGGLRVMEPAERELRVHLSPLVKAGILELLPHEGWLASEADLEAGAGPTPPWRMDAFYRHLRRSHGILLEDDGSPTGGKWSFDGENRNPWHGQPPAPDPPTFQPDDVTQEVLDFVARAFADHPGRLDGTALPATRTDAEASWTWALNHALPHFGPFEDAMSRRSRTLFHTRISPLLNLHRLLAADVVADVETLEVDGELVPLQSREGFIRQVLGWREFVRLVHRRTDGFRHLNPAPPVRASPGFAGWWTGEVKTDSGPDSDPDGGAAPSHLSASNPLPPAWWGQTSGMACLDQVVAGVLEEGWVHHIPRLMVLSNLATLLDVEPRELTDWFWVGFVDAFDWVVEPNVLAMGTFATGPVMTTKPYVSGTPYIRKMGDFCDDCELDPETSCPISHLYWAFLERHRDRLKENRRLALPLASAARRDEATRTADSQVFQAVSEALEGGARVTARLVEDARAVEAPPVHERSGDPPEGTST